MEPVSVFIFSRLLILCKIHLLPTSDVFAQARISQDTEHFLLNPFGMLYNEITASSLVKVNMQVRGHTVQYKKIQCFGSGSVLDPYSIGPLDPDP